MNATLIAANTYREAIRDRLMIGVLVAGAALLAITQVITPLALGEGRRLTIDLGLSGISVLGVFVVMLVGTSLVAKELERRTIYNLLARPIARPTYIVGKWLGLTAALWTVTLALGAGLVLVMVARGFRGPVTPLAEGVYLAGLELSVVAAVAVMFSALSTPVLSALYTLGFYAVGQWTGDLRAFADKAPDGLAHLLRTIANVMPNLPLFNVRTLVADGQAAGALHLALATGYALLYATCVLALAAAAFETRDLK